MFELTAIPAFRDNYIWLLEQGGEALVVDPGEAAPVLTALEARRLNLRAILVTHHHADHQGGVAALVEHCRPEVFGPAAESITGRTVALRGGEVLRFDWLESTFEVIAVPGHTLGHLAYYGGGHLFCGDTLFGAGCGRLFEGSPAQMLASLDRLAALPSGTAVCCAHEYTEANLRFAEAVEPENAAVRQRAATTADLRARGVPTLPSSIALERATNPFLRCSEPEVVAAMKGRTGGAGDRLAVFTALREWKNGF